MDTNYKYEDFKIDYDEPLGKGGFSEVYKATQKNTGKVYGIKRFPKENLFKEELDNMKLMNIKILLNILDILNIKIIYI